MRSLGLWTDQSYACTYIQIKLWFLKPWCWYMSKSTYVRFLESVWWKVWDLKLAPLLLQIQIIIKLVHMLRLALGSAVKQSLLTLWRSRQLFSNSLEEKVLSAYIMMKIIHTKAEGNPVIWNFWWDRECFLLSWSVF